MIRRELKTGRLTLRLYRKDEAPMLALNANDYDVVKMTGRMAYPYTLEHAEAYIANHRDMWARGSAYPFGIFRGGVHIGGAGLHLGGIEGGEKPWELGYWIAELFWGFGFASEAANAMLDFAFRDLELKCVYAGHFFDNPASGHVLKKLGFRYLYDTEVMSLARGGPAISHEFELTLENWRAAKARLSSDRNAG